MCAAKPTSADLRARSSASWMLTGAQVGRAEVAELFDLFQQLHDAAGFLDDQVGQLAILGGQAHRQKLRRAGDARERVLDLMRQHLGHADGGLRGRT